MAKTLDQMMEELLTLYHGTEWYIEVCRTKDAGGAMVPSVYAVLGRYSDNELSEEIEPIYIDDKGNEVDSKDFRTYLEVSGASLDSSVEYVITDIYREVMKRRLNGNQN